MLGVDDLRVGAVIEGVAGSGPVTLLHVDRVGEEAAEITWRSTDGRLGSSILFPAELSRLKLAEAGRPFAFIADGALFQLAMEAQRIRLAYLFDPYVAVTTSSIEPLPHQITAVYGEMLQRQPLRFLLADDPGAGKTIMAGLLIKELMIRGDLRRCLVVAPGSLVEQWQDELHDKFGLDFDILSRDRFETARTGNPFQEQDRWICRLDQLSRSEAVQARLEAAPEFDLIVCDEAHRMSASYFSSEVRYTKRYLLGQRLAKRCRHLLLMSATPHNGKDADFQLFLALLDGDRFEGRFRDGVHTADPSDLMRRLTKEELVTFEGRRLFPERLAYTAGYRLSPDEAALYEAVTGYVREEMNRADRVEREDGDQRRRQTVGFALQVLQRRLASSPAAIHASLKRRLDRLRQRLEEERLRARGQEQRAAAESAPTLSADELEELDDRPEAEIEDLEQAVLDTASAARTLQELAAEIATLARLEDQAKALVRSGRDAKWQQLLSILDHPLMTGPGGSRRKLIVFSEPRDTLTYLVERIRNRLGRAEAVEMIHGGIGREERRRVVEAFRNDPRVLVLVANDAAGEGVNLQRAHLMVNYDLPWNPNRLEQRFGRIHRIGQTEVCHLWNLVAHETREGQVYLRLLEKLEAARTALGGRVFDVLGRLFEERPLRDLLVDAIRFGEQPEVRARLMETIDGAVDRARLEELLAERALVPGHLDRGQVEAVRAAMERAAARRLQPRFVQRFFLDAFERLGGTVRRREPGRFEITRVPAQIRERDRLIGRGDVILSRYERITFDTAAVPGNPQAVLVCPGHPLLDGTVDLVREQFGRLLREGAVLVDPADAGSESRLLLVLQHAIHDGRTTRTGEPLVIAEDLAFVVLRPDGGIAAAGPAPHLDCRPATSDEREAAAGLLEGPWLADDIERRARVHASAELIPRRLEEARARRLAEVAKVEREVTRRLKAEIAFWDNRANALREEERAGKETRLSSQNAAARADMLAGRLQARLELLAKERTIAASPPRLVAAALIVPQGWFGAGTGEPQADSSAEVRAAVEAAAMRAVLEAERRQGFEPVDVSAAKLGWDIESVDPLTQRRRLLEVKGRACGADTVTVTCNEVLAALNAPEYWALVLVEVDGGVAAPPRYIRGFPFKEPGVGEAAVIIKTSGLLAHAADA